MSARRWAVFVVVELLLLLAAVFGSGPIIEAIFLTLPLPVSDRVAAAFAVLRDGLCGGGLLVLSVPWLVAKDRARLRRVLILSGLLVTVSTAIGGRLLTRVAARRFRRRVSVTLGKAPRPHVKRTIAFRAGGSGGVRFAGFRLFPGEPVTRVRDGCLGRGWRVIALPPLTEPDWFRSLDRGDFRTLKLVFGPFHADDFYGRLLSLREADGRGFHSMAPVVGVLETLVLRAHMWPRLRETLSLRRRDGVTFHVAIEAPDDSGRTRMSVIPTTQRVELEGLVFLVDEPKKVRDCLAWLSRCEVSRTPPRPGSGKPVYVVESGAAHGLVGFGLAIRPAGPTLARLGDRPEALILAPVDAGSEPVTFVADRAGSFAASAEMDGRLSVDFGSGRACWSIVQPDYELRLGRTISARLGPDPEDGLRLTAAGGVSLGFGRSGADRPLERERRSAEAIMDRGETELGTWIEVRSGGALRRICRPFAGGGRWRVWAAGPADQADRVRARHFDLLCSLILAKPE